jgi:hypothetical protein
MRLLDRSGRLLHAPLCALCWVSLLAPAEAFAQDVTPPPQPKPEEAARRLEALEQKNEELRAELDQLRSDHDFDAERIEKLMPLSGRFTGYVDFGFFFVGGDGSGIRNDIGHERLPEYAATSSLAEIPDSWVFMGDPLSTAINSRGEPADTGESRAITFDPVDSKGKSSFILNSLNLSLFAGIGEDLTLNGSVDFVPRGRDVSDPDGAALGDFIDVKLAYAEYIAPFERFKLSLFAGKFDSVLGFEYRSQDAPDRLTVTPSLVCRYTCGRPLGLKARGTFFGDHLTLNVSGTNGTHFSEGFPFHDEIDSNQWKTLAGRLSSRTGEGTGLEVGVSGAFGAQDRQDDDAVHQWHYGVDLNLDWHDILVTGEFVQGRAPGATEPGQRNCGLAPCIRYKAAYGLLGYRLFNWLTPYARVDWRDALHESGESFVYISQLVRGTGGLRFEVGTNVIIKAEYTVNRELGIIPQFANDVFTSSMVIRY